MSVLEEVKLDFPFDLNNLFHLSYSFDTLKQSIEFLAKNQAKMMRDMSILGSTQGGDGAQLSAEALMKLSDLEALLKQTRGDVDRLNDRDKENLDWQKQAQETLDKLLQSVRDHENRLNETDNSLTLLKSMNGGGNDVDGKGLLDAIETMIENLRKECYAQFMPRTEFSDLNERVLALEELTKCHDTSIYQTRDIADQNKIDIEELQRKLAAALINLGAGSDTGNGIDTSQFEDLLRRLADLEQNKVDALEFRNEIASLREMIGNTVAEDSTNIQVTPVTSGVSLSQAEMNKLREMFIKVAKHEETLNKLLSDFKNLDIQVLKESLSEIKALMGTFASKADYESLRKEFDEMKKAQDLMKVDIEDIRGLLDALKNAKSESAEPSAGPSSSEMILIRNRVEYLESQLTQVKKFVQELKNRIEELEQKDVGTGGGSGGADEAWMRELENQLKKLRADFDKFKKDTNDNFIQFGQHLDQKADRSELIDLENRLTEKINEMIKQLLLKFADKTETKKKLTAIEKNIKNLYELLMARGNSHDRGHEEDAMFTKKPLGGVSCASCERNIQNLSGQMADYQPWKKLPFREPNDRIARYGQGFSKILAMMRPEPTDSRIENSQFLKRSQHAEEQNIDHSIHVDMPNSSTKNSARTGIHFYKGSNVPMKRHFEDSPPKVVDTNSGENILPNVHKRQNHSIGL